MELRHVRYFAAVARELSFTKAAALVRVAQPAVSRQIQDLEEELGVTLLHRGPRGISLTPEGLVLLHEANVLLKHVDELVAKVRDRSHPPSPSALTNRSTPYGWSPAGSHPDDYLMCGDPEVLRNGKRSVRIELRAPTPHGFGTLMQEIDACNYLGKRLRFSAEVKTIAAAGGAIWMRVDGRDQILAFDNMDERGGIGGTTDWHRYEVVLDVDVEATTINIGLLLVSGLIWMADLALDVVENDVPLTNISGLHNTLPKSPLNLMLDVYPS